MGRLSGRITTSILAAVFMFAAVFTLPVPWTVHAALPHENETGYHLENIDKDYTYTIIKNPEGKQDYLYFGCCGWTYGGETEGWWSGWGDLYGYYDYKGEWHTTGGIVTENNGHTCEYCGAGPGSKIGKQLNQTSGTKTVHETGNAWLPNTYTVSYNANGGTGTVSSQSAAYDTAFNLQSNGYSRTGCTFSGWNTKSDGTGTSYAAGASVSNLTAANGGTVNLYAIWTANTYTQTLNFYQGSTKFAAKTYSIAYGTTFSAYDHRFDAGTPDNYHYSSVSTVSWTVTGDAGADVYFDINQMNVVYDGNGATSGSTAGTSIDYNSRLAVASNGFSKTYFHFLEWNTKSDGSGTSYNPGSTITVKPASHGQEYRLYAVWERDIYTQTINYYRYEYNNGAWSWVKDKSVTYSAGAGLTFDAASKAGAETISGYYYDSIDAGSWTVMGTASTNAYFKPNTYNVSYNGNGSTAGSTAAATGCTYSLPFTLRDNGFTKTYYDFNGWNTKADGTGTAYSDGAQAVNLTTVNNGTAALYAQWIDVTAPTVSVSENSTNGSWVHYMDVAVTADDNGDGLSTDSIYQYCLCQDDASPDGTWNTYTNKLSFSIGAGLTGTYYLYIRPVTDKAGNKSTDTYHKFGPYLFDNSAPANDIQFVYGWYESATEVDFGIHDDYSGISSIILKDFYDTPVADITSSGKYIFDTDGENFYSIIMTDNLGSTATRAFMVKLSKYEEVIPKNAVWKGLDNLRVYANWTPITYSVVFDGNGAASGSTAAMRSLVYDTDYELNANGFVREYYAFDRWNTKADGTGLRYADRQTVSNLSDTQGATITLYAQWTDISAPQLDVNPSSCSDIVRNLDITITVDEKGSGLDSSNSYEYGLSISPDVPPDTWNFYTDGTALEEGFSADVNIGDGLDGTYYLWVKQIKDSYGNTSVSDTCTDAVYDGVTYHVCGTYIFDNTGPTGDVTYIENNETLGLWSEEPARNVYALIHISDAADELSGISRIYLQLEDAANPENHVELDFTKDLSGYELNFFLYDKLADSEHVDKVRMTIYAVDAVGNLRELTITDYDFGTDQRGVDITADDIAFKRAPEGGYERDYFRIEAYIENVSYDATGTTFMCGHYGNLRIYTFGYVEQVSADFGSIRHYIREQYDTELNLPVTTLDAMGNDIYAHRFKIPLYAEYGLYTDAAAYGSKGNTQETRAVSYDVYDSILLHVKTIYKYNVD